MDEILAEIDELIRTLDAARVECIRLKRKVREFAARDPDKPPVGPLLTKSSTFKKPDGV